MLLATPKLNEPPAERSTNDRSKDAPALISVNSPNPSARTASRFVVERRQRIIDGDLHVIRRSERECLHDDAEHQHLDERTLQPRHPPPQLTKLQTLALLAAFEIVGGAKLQRDAREMVRQLREAEPVRTAIRIVDQRLAALDLFQHDEMVHVPMEHGRHVKIFEFFERELHGPSRQARAGPPSQSTTSTTNRASTAGNGGGASRDRHLGQTCRRSSPSEASPHSRHLGLADQAAPASSP